MGIEDFVDRKAILKQEQAELGDVNWVDRESTNRLQMTFESPLQYQKKSGFLKYVACVGALGLAALATYAGITMVSVEPPKSQINYSKPVVTQKKPDCVKKPETFDKGAISLPELTDENIGKALENENIVIDVWAPWCGPCKSYSKPFAKTSEKHKSVYFAKMNLEGNRKNIAELVSKGVLEENVRAIPCTIFIQGGKEVDRFTGANTQKLEQYISKYFPRKNK